MSSINNVGSQSPIPKVIANPVHRDASTGAPVPTARAGGDKLELSGVSHLLSALKSNDIRAEKVAQIKAQIEAGTYESDEKLTAAADRLLDELTER